MGALARRLRARKICQAFSDIRWAGAHNPPLYESSITLTMSEDLAFHLTPRARS